MRDKKLIALTAAFTAAVLSFTTVYAGPADDMIKKQEQTEVAQSIVQSESGPVNSSAPMQSTGAKQITTEVITLNPNWKYAGNSVINSGAATLYKVTGQGSKGKTVCINAGHGTSGVGSKKTLCHPDGSPKVTGGTTGAGATTAVAVSSGTTMNDGTPENKITLKAALAAKDKLIQAGYSVLMIRESGDVQLDNVARTVIANNMADCHIAIHYDSTQNDKGAFFMSVPSNASYRAMEPVASHWAEHNALGTAVIGGLRGAGVKIWSSGALEMDLTQTSYSTVPSIDIEVGDRGSSYSDEQIAKIASGITTGVGAYFGM